MYLPLLQLLDVLTAEDERVLADVQALVTASELIREQQREIFEKKRLMRYEIINDRLESYKRVSCTFTANARVQ